MALPTAAEILAFWRDAGPDKWFTKDEAFDAEIRTRFLGAYEAAAAGQLHDWEATPDGVYALLLLLDQFPRNIFRGSPKAFATDALAVAVTERAIARGFDEGYANPERRFFYMPLQHAEDLAHQQRCVDLSHASGDEDSTKWAIVHRDIIREFGRFPHRNPVLGRDTTPEEQAFLDEGGFKG